MEKIKIALGNHQRDQKRLFGERNEVKISCETVPLNSLFCASFLHMKRRCGNFRNLYSTILYCLSGKFFINILPVQLLQKIYHN